MVEIEKDDCATIQVHAIVSYRIELAAILVYLAIHTPGLHKHHYLTAAMNVLDALVSRTDGDRDNSLIGLAHS